MGRPGNIFKPCPHFQCQPEGRSQLGNTLANRLNAKHQMIVLAGHHPHEASFSRPCHRFAVGGKRKLPDHGLIAFGVRCVGRQPD